jgi:pyridoxamine 5'-phosphate oxidase
MDPFVKFADWYDEAQKDPSINPDIVALASATKDGQPSVRMVYYRGIREGGFSFFTNYKSRKGLDFSENPRAAMAFYWPHLGRQVRVEGRVQRLSAEESDSYFRSRPFQSQITAVVSRQSHSLSDPNELRIQLANLEQSFLGKPIVRPEYWGGFKIVPLLFEFWLRGDHRRHDRLLYKKNGEGWEATRLYP